MKSALEARALPKAVAVEYDDCMEFRYHCVWLPLVTLWHIRPVRSLQCYEKRRQG